MARARLQRGEASAVTYRGMIDGKWTMASKIPGDRKPSKWRATVRYQDGSSPRPKEITAEGKSKRDIIRCLKRYVIREVYHLIKVNPRTGEIAS